jgi:hypothetical protein
MADSTLSSTGGGKGSRDDSRTSSERPRADQSDEDSSTGGGKAEQKRGDSLQQEVRRASHSAIRKSSYSTPEKDRLHNFVSHLRREMLPKTFKFSSAFQIFSDILAESTPRTASAKDIIQRVNAAINDTDPGNPTVNRTPKSSKSMATCRYFNRSGGCFQGDSCKYLHSIDSDTQQANRVDHSDSVDRSTSSSRNSERRSSRRGESDSEQEGRHSRDRYASSGDRNRYRDGKDDDSDKSSSDSRRKRSRLSR